MSRNTGTTPQDLQGSTKTTGNNGKARAEAEQEQHGKTEDIQHADIVQQSRPVIMGKKLI